MNKIFYAIAVEEKENYTIIPDTSSENISVVRETRKQEDCPEGLVILRCEVIE